MIFSYTAMSPQGSRLTETLEAADRRAAQRELLQRGLMVLSLEPHAALRGARAALGAAAASRPAVTSGGTTASARLTELVLFARQLAMMQKAGAALVPAVRAVQEQPGRAGWKALLADVAERLEGGVSLSDALRRHSRYFNGMMLSIIEAGESTGSLAESFTRVAAILELRARIRKRIIAAVAYPAMLLLLSIAVVVTMTTFVLPRFASLFAMLNSELPQITKLMLAASTHLQTWWPVMLLGMFAVPALAVLWARTPSGNDLLSRVVLRLPVIGKTVSAVVFARLLQLWAALLRSRVPLLEAIRHGREVSRNVVFRQLVDELETAVTEGRSMTQVLRSYPIVPPPVVAAISTGEESGRLGESMEFVGSWLEEESQSLISSATRLLEPAILILLGVVVGGVAISLFMPLFDIATAA
ncbi:putative type II secretion system protein F [Phycisphaerae bacterium RAS1]|nr:putative type II secretion system protein F [Phycisphaerae bacterium RAS1]